MELSLINNVVSGVLQPWQLANQSERFFSDLLECSGRKLPLSTFGLSNFLQKLLRDYTELIQPLNLTQDEKLLQPLFSSTLPEPENTNNEFYLLIIKLDALRYMFELHHTIEHTEDENEKYYMVNAALQKVRYQVVASDELENQARNNNLLQGLGIDNDTSGNIVRNTLFAIEIIQKIATALFFEIQTRYESYVKSLETEQQFYRSTLKHTRQVTLTPTYHFYVWKVENLITNKETSAAILRNLYSEIAMYAINNTYDVADLQTGFENYVCSLVNEAGDMDNRLSTYSLPETSEYLFNESKNEIENSFGKLRKGYERLERINVAGNKMLIQVLPSSQSAIGKLNNWLNLQRSLYASYMMTTFDAPEDIKSNKSASTKNEKLSFGFHKDPKILKSVIAQLISSIYLLDENRNTTEDLFKLLTSKTIIPESSQIHIACETVQFAYIVENLQSSFSNLNPSSIEKSKCFYSKKDILLKAQNLYSNKISSPKDQENIDSIINQLQQKA